MAIKFRYGSILGSRKDKTLAITSKIFQEISYKESSRSSIKLDIKLDINREISSENGNEIFSYEIFLYKNTIGITSRCDK